VADFFRWTTAINGCIYSCCHYHQFEISCTWFTSCVVTWLCQAQGGASSSTLHKLNVDIVRVFVDARYHIPQHRCLLLFYQLVEKLGVSRTLCIVGLLIIESSIRTKDVPALLPHDDGESQVSYSDCHLPAIDPR
jgi:hypothetical protein